jgi:opacity protein-like surface antigen
MLKPLPLLLLLTSIGLAQSLRFGIEGGLPLTNGFDTQSSSVIPVAIPAGPINYSTLTKRYTVGPTAELDLPFHLAVKADVLYKRLSFGSAGLAPITTTTTTANSWEFSLLGKYGVSKLGPLQPYVEGGVAFRAVQGVNQISVSPCLGCATSVIQSTSHPTELAHSFTKGFTGGAGLEFRHLLVGVFGEIRYTRWTADAFSAPNGGLNSTRNQADLLVGVTF